MNTVNLNLLKHRWTANVLLNNGKEISIWHTAWPMIKASVKEVLSVSSDYPKSKLNP